jgi:hypothetical protein
MADTDLTFFPVSKDFYDWVHDNAKQDHPEPIHFMQFGGIQSWTAGEHMWIWDGVEMEDNANAPS